jgi:predicted transcriptional regulator
LIDYDQVSVYNEVNQTSRRRKQSKLSQMPVAFTAETERREKRMLHTERRETIIEILKTKDTASIHELVELTGASEATVRRDLSKLESDEQIKRIHGGASLSRRRRNEPTIAEKSSVNQWEKKKLQKLQHPCLNLASAFF